MYFKRDIWDELLYWKEHSRHTLEVRGARQVGKTYILRKFCSEEFRDYVYINMLDNTGKKFLKSIAAWESSDSDKIVDLMKIYLPRFEDAQDIAVLIDEIQASSTVYNLIRKFTRELTARVVITGSYLGKLLDKEYFLPAGDLSTVTMYSMSFPEFLGAFGLRKTYEQCYLEQKLSDRLKQFFRLYTTIGGYPSVVSFYMDTEDENACFNELERILDIFVSESSRYFSDMPDYDVFGLVLSKISRLAVTGKKGKNLIESLNKIVIKLGESRIKKRIYR